MEARAAFDLSRYATKPPSAVAADLAAVSIEYSQAPTRVYPFLLALHGSTVVNPELGPHDISTMYSSHTKLDRMEREAGLSMRDCLLHKPEGTLAIWISPPGGPLNYPESRIVVGLNERNTST
jgi:hypothetical protein